MKASLPTRPPAPSPAAKRRAALISLVLSGGALLVSALRRVGPTVARRAARRWRGLRRSSR